MNCGHPYPPLKRTITQTAHIYLSSLLATTLVLYLNPIATAQTIPTEVEGGRAIPITVPPPTTSFPAPQQQPDSGTQILVPPSDIPATETPSSTQPVPNPVSPNRKTLSELLILPPTAIDNPNYSVDLSSEPNLVPIVNVEPEYLQPNDYLVMAETLNKEQEEQLTAIYPIAAATMFNRQLMWQVGAFRSWENAETMLAKLNNLGFSGLIIRQEELERFQKLVKEPEAEETETEATETEDSK